MVVRIPMDARYQQHFTYHTNGLTTAKFRIFMQMVTKWPHIQCRKWFRHKLLNTCLFTGLTFTITITTLPFTFVKLYYLCNMIVF